jgi:hypothetical protein
MKDIVVLMIDDKEDYYLSIKGFAERNDVKLLFRDNLEDGVELLRSSIDIFGVVLDGKGFLKSGQPQGSESESFIHEALTQIRVLEEKRGIHYAKIALTAWASQLEESLKGRIKVFDKSKIAINPEEKTRLFTYLKNEIVNIKDYLLIRKYSRELQLVEKLLSKEHYNIVVEVCSLIEEEVISYNDSYTKLRILLEAGLKKLNKDSSLLDNKLFHPDGRPNLGWITRYFKGLVISVDNNRTIIFPAVRRGEHRVPPHIASSFSTLSELSNIKSHDYVYKTDKSLFQGTFCHLISFLKWVDDSIEE